MTGASLEAAVAISCIVTICCSHSMTQRMLWLSGILILYGSWYPFDVDLDADLAAGVKQLLDLSPSSWVSTDAVGNIILMVPYGFFAAMSATAGGRALLSRILVRTMLGLAIASIAQLGQLFISSRVPAGEDITWNTVGLVAGLTAGVCFKRGRDWFYPEFRGISLPVLLAIGWLAYQWIPFVPTLDAGLIQDNLKRVIDRGYPEPIWVFQNSVVWLIVFHLFARHTALGYSRLWPLPAFFVLAAGATFVGVTVSLDDFTGLALAAGIWLFRPGLWRPGLFALLLLVAILGDSFQSLQVREIPANFSWIPFSGALGGNVLLNVVATFKKLVLYAMLIWLLCASGLQAHWATLATAAILFISEWLQVFAVGATPEITDAVLALGLGAWIATADNPSSGRLMQRGCEAGYDPSKTTPVSGAGDIHRKRLEQESRPDSGKPGRTRLTRSRLSSSRARAAAAVSLTLACSTAGVMLYLHQRSDFTPMLVRQHAWSNAPVILTADLHTHSTSSDGQWSEAELVRRASESGCDVLAITDHSDVQGSASDAQFDQLSQLRREFPGILLFLGIEAEMPSYKGREHLNVILNPEDERGWLPILKRQLMVIGDETPESDRPFFELLEALEESGARAFVSYNHPSRKVPSVSQTLGDLERWSRHGGHIDALGGGPGHQLQQPIGSYSEEFPTRDRWDPAVEEIGGVWDQYIGSGRDIWGALANSDFHAPRYDALPCGFARIHLSAPEASYPGVMEALDAGTFWSEHGPLLESLQFSIDLPGLDRLVYAGETARYGRPGDIALARVSLKRRPNPLALPLTVEFISSCIQGETELIASHAVGNMSDTVVQAIPLQSTGTDGRSCILRVRVRGPEVGSEHDLMAYTNYVRLMAP